MQELLTEEVAFSYVVQYDRLLSASQLKDRLLAVLRVVEPETTRPLVIAMTNDARPDHRAVTALFFHDNHEDIPVVLNERVSQKILDILYSGASKRLYYISYPESWIILLGTQSTAEG